MNGRQLVRAAAASRAGAAVASAVAGVAVWYAVSFALLDARRRAFLLPPPHDVVRDGVFDWSDGTVDPNLGDGIEAMFTTGRVALVGLVVAAILGIAVALAMSRSRFLERAITPYAVMVQVVPVLALVPVIGHWWGFTFRSRVIACVLIAIFPIIVNTLAGLQSADPALRELFALHRATPGQRLWRLELPSAVPQTLVGLRIGAGGAVVGAIVGDFFFRRGSPGLGRLLDDYAKSAQTADLLVAVGLAVVLGLAFVLGLGALTRATTRRFRPADSAAASRP